ncbi:MAG: DUF456 domain-containing protein [Deltaproteobacteria bacterium]|nr:MAG: DUF456 domain-containing protein [Deltaproteobacteria bacterium]
MTILTIILIIIGFLFALTALAGCIVSPVPGPSFSLVALVILSYAKNWEPFSPEFLIAVAILTIFLEVLNYVIPLIGAKKYDASKQGMWGSVIGMIGGVFIFPPWGIFVGAFAGALIGELIAGKERDSALRVGWGIFLGNMAGIGLKLSFSGIALFLYVTNMF